MDVCGVDYLEHGRSRMERRRDATSFWVQPGVGSGAAADAPVAAGRSFAVVYNLISCRSTNACAARFLRDDAEPMVDSIPASGPGALFEARGLRHVRHSVKGTLTCARLLTDYGLSGIRSQDLPRRANVEVRYDPEAGPRRYQPVSSDRAVVPKV